MNSTISRCFRLALAAACVIATVITHAPSARADYTWLGSDTAFGGNGTWDNATTASWSPDGISTTPVVWAPNNIAAFTTSAGTVTVDGAIQNLLGLKFSAAYILNPVNGGTLTFPTTASQQYTINATANTSIAAALAGGASTSIINKTGSGTLTISGNNSFSLNPNATTVPTSGITVIDGSPIVIPGFTVSAGVVEFTGDNSGVTGQFNTNASGATLAVGSNTALGTTNRIRIHVAGGVIRSTDTTKRTLANFVDLATSATLGSSSAATNGELEFTGTFATGNGAKTITVLSTVTFSGVVTGGPNTNSNTKAGSGTLVLTAANTYDKPTIISDGTLRVSLSGRLGNPGNTKTVTVADIALLDMQVAGISDAATLSLTSTDSTAEVNLALGVNDVIAGLTINGVAMANGTYGSTSSGAANLGLANANDIFSGSGMVTVIPEPSSVALSAFAAATFLARRRRQLA